jgi:pyruvate dehydrogenase E2 component (dihydrolipoamide acetyltransferase)
VESLYGVIYPPQVAILGFGAVTRKPVAVENSVEIRPIVTATLSADHRVSDGHLGSRFLKQIGSLLQEPGKL